MERQGAQAHAAQARRDRTIAMTPRARERLLDAPARDPSGCSQRCAAPTTRRVALPPLESGPLFCRPRQRRPLHRHPPSLRLVRLERPRARPRGHRAALRPPRRRRPGTRNLWALRPGQGARAHPQSVQPGACLDTIYRTPRRVNLPHGTVYSPCRQCPAGLLPPSVRHASAGAPRRRELTGCHGCHYLPDLQEKCAVSRIFLSTNRPGLRRRPGFGSNGTGNGYV